MLLSILLTTVPPPTPANGVNCAPGVAVEIVDHVEVCDSNRTCRVIAESGNSYWLYDPAAGEIFCATDVSQPVDKED